MNLLKSESWSYGHKRHQIRSELQISKEKLQSPIKLKDQLSLTEKYPVLERHAIQYFNSNGNRSIILI